MSKNNTSVKGLEKISKKIMIFLKENNTNLGQSFNLEENNLLKKLIDFSGVNDSKELSYVLDELSGKEYISYLNRYKLKFKITPSGYSYIEKISVKDNSKGNIFCAMWFDESVNIIWDKAIKTAILSCGYQPIRIDEKEHINRIDQEVLDQIKTSKLVIADFTGQRGGVYFETGYALGVGVPVVWTVEKNNLQQLHFDIRQYKFIIWENDKLNIFMKKLKNIIPTVASL